MGLGGVLGFVGELFQNVSYLFIPLARKTPPFRVQDVGA
ncbi:hypothetical protein HPCPY3281_0272 [Helicobacter pylori CPY3281]|nr:hypothetical protein HPCPY3281_0272 [Helicobacter pylori CPY3281]